MPVILAVDGDSSDLADTSRELRDRYGSGYRVIATDSPKEAEATLSTLADSGDDVALVLAAQGLREALDGDLFERVRAHHPHAKRGLLVSWRAWADPETAQAIFDLVALGRIDYYVLKPGAPPDEVFHETVTGFLAEWRRSRRESAGTIHVIGEEWSGRAYELRQTLQRCAMPHSFCLADSDEAREILADAGPQVEFPAMVLPDGEILSNPSNREIGEVSGEPIDFDEALFDLVIVGAGPAGLSAAVYGSSEGLHTLVVDEGGVGGQATSSSRIRNYLGFPRGVSGTRLAERAYEQAWVFGTRFLFMHRAAKLERDDGGLAVVLSEGERIRSRAVLLVTGASYRRLGVPSLEALSGAGVFYGGPESEGHAMIGRDVFVVGGANSAGQAALYLARFARRVTLVVRARTLAVGMSHYLVREIEATPGIEVRSGTTVVDGGGDGHVDHLVLRGDEGDETVAADALFVLVGARPRTDWLPDELARDGQGFLLTGEDIPAERAGSLARPPFSLETSMPGVFAAGDVRHGSPRRVASAVGEGSVAVQQLHAMFVSQRLRSAAAKVRRDGSRERSGAGTGAP